MSNAIKGLNSIPVRTWRWLGVNDTSIKGNIPAIKAYNKSSAKQVGNDKLKIIDIKDNEGVIKLFTNSNDIGISIEATEMALRSYNSGYLIEAESGEKIVEPIFIDYSMDEENPHVVDNNVIIAEEDSEVTIIMKYSSEREIGAFHNGITRLYAKKGSMINLIKVQLMSDDSIHLDAIAGVEEDGAKINYVLVELGAKNSITSCKNELQGNMSRNSLHSIYLGDKDRQIDINYIMNHIGKETVSNIESRGVLMDKSSKIFRGTLDFKRGASGSKGKEEEYAVLLSTNVRNRSVPLLLCGEDDVEGQHAASTGKVDENKLFYLMSRGFSELEAKKLIVEAAFNPIMEKIPQEQLKEEISEYIRRRLVNA